jgi:hypothetical protein
MTAKSALEKALMYSVPKREKAGFHPPKKPNPTTPAVPIATPIGTWHAINTNIPTIPSTAIEIGSIFNSRARNQ